MPAMPGPIPPVDGAGGVQLCGANVPGVLAVGTPAAPPAQLGGTDSGPMDDPEPAAANTGAAPRPPTPPRPAAPPMAAPGPTSPAKAVPRPPKSAEAVEGPASAVIKPPPPIPIKSDSADAKLPTSSIPTEPKLLDKGEPVSKAVRAEMAPVIVVGAALDAADDAPDDAEFAAAWAALADSVPW